MRFADIRINLGQIVNIHITLSSSVTFFLAGAAVSKPCPWRSIHRSHPALGPGRPEQMARTTSSRCYNSTRFSFKLRLLFFFWGGGGLDLVACLNPNQLAVVAIPASRARVRRSKCALKSGRRYALTLLMKEYFSVRDVFLCVRADEIFRFGYPVRGASISEFEEPLARSQTHRLSSRCRQRRLGPESYFISSGSSSRRGPSNGRVIKKVSFVNHRSELVFCKMDTSNHARSCGSLASVVRLIRRTQPTWLSQALQWSHVTTSFVSR